MKSRPLLLFYILVGYVLLQFAWWGYLMIQQNNEIYLLKSQINLFNHEDPQLIIEKGNELETKLKHRWMMIAGEGMVFSLLLGFAFLQVRNTFKKESELSAQQKNFLLSVTHELKSPLASVKLTLETLLKRDLDKEKQNKLLSNAIDDTDRLNKLVENMLLATKIDNNAFSILKEEVNLSTLTEDILKQTINLFNPTQKINLSIQPNINYAIDKILFPSIILNLFENAVKYSPENYQINISLSEKGNTVTLTVSDEGLGIPEAEKNLVFNKFYRVGNEEVRNSKGTGLGLYIVKYLVEKHNGAILIKNNNPQGSIFEVTLKKG